MSVAASDSAAPAQQARSELADVFARYADEYFGAHAATQTPEPAEAKTVADWARDPRGIDITRCPHCGAPLEREELSPLRLQFHCPRPSLSYWDTS